MGLLDGKTQAKYYGGEGDAFGSYQFTSLTDIINYFMIAYVGENKIIPKAKVAEIAFHAQRALQELSFDTLKSVKSQEIVLPPSLTITLPHDYVDYTKLSWSDSSGIKHPLYKTNSTSNPFSVKLIDYDLEGEYFFGMEAQLVVNNDFSSILLGTWNYSPGVGSGAWNGYTPAMTGATSTGKFPNRNFILDEVSVVGTELEFSTLWGTFGGSDGRTNAAWQMLDVTGVEFLTLKSEATSGDQVFASGTTNVVCEHGVVRVGLSSVDPAVGWPQGTGSNVGGIVTAYDTIKNHPNKPSPNGNPNNLDIGYLEWINGDSSEKEIEDIDVTAYDTVWVYVQNESPWLNAGITPFINYDAKTTSAGITTFTFDDSVVAAGYPFAGGSVTEPWDVAAIGMDKSVNNTHQKNQVNSVSVTIDGQNKDLTSVIGPGRDSSTSETWSKYKSAEDNENTNDNYKDNNYNHMSGNRYGLDPQYSQINGSFYIDNRLGKINFSSNIAGKTVILDYISDSLGTDAEMQVHKFAEEAMYKCIAHSMLSTTTYGQQLIPRLTKEKFAAVRKAKLRLSGLNIEELTQILRGKSKQIKH
tara:strand:+ start:806 stop:2554 length:1749 start_codon:yes stop_codon:yes gene_type:complete